MREYYAKVIIGLNITSNAFYLMTINEIEDLLAERDKQDKISQLRQARYNAMLIQNDKARDNYDAIMKEEIDDKNDAELQKKYKRYEMISKRLGLKFPKNEVI